MSTTGGSAAMAAPIRARASSTGSNRAAMAAMRGAAPAPAAAGPAVARRSFRAGRGSRERRSASRSRAFARAVATRAVSRSMSYTSLRRARVSWRSERVPEEFLDAVLPGGDVFEAAERADKPLLQQAPAHRSERAIEDPEQRSLELALAEGARQLQAELGRAVEHDAVRGAHAGEAADMAEGDFLRLLEILERRARRRRARGRGRRSRSLRATGRGNPSRRVFCAVSRPKAQSGRGVIIAAVSRRKRSRRPSLADASVSGRSSSAGLSRLSSSPRRPASRSSAQN